MNKKKLELKDYLLISFICVLFGVFYLLAGFTQEELFQQL